MFRRCCTALLILAACSAAEENNKDEGLVIVTTKEGTADGHDRFLRSAKAAEAEVIALPAGESADSGAQVQEVTRLRAQLEQSAVSPRRLVLVLRVPTSDVIVAAAAGELQAEFEQQKGRVVFVADVKCRPDEKLASEYPVGPGYRFLNSNAFIGYGPDLVALLSDETLLKDGGDQLAFTKLFLDEKRREKYGVRIDNAAELLQNLEGAEEEVVVRFKGRQAFLQNVPLSTVPLVALGSGASKQHLDTLGNYLAGVWDPREGCRTCWDGQKELGDKTDTFPRVLLAVFIDQPTPFLEEFFNNIWKLNYPKSKIDLLVYNAAPFHDKMAADFVEHGSGIYASVKLLGPEEKISKMAAREQTIEAGMKGKAEFFMFVDSTAHLNNPHALKLLIEQNRDIVAPMLIRPYSFWANFKIELSVDRNNPNDISSEYKTIVTNKRKGLWNMPYISECYLVKRAVLENKNTRPDFSDGKQTDVHEVFSSTMRQAGKFMLLSNRIDFGHLVDPAGFDTSRLHSEMWQIFANRWDWERRYIHENYSKALDESLPVAEPCQDVFWVPMITERFCQELIDTMEDFGQWSSGTHEDSRIEGGYESVPTRDIHMKQINFDLEWHQFLREYVQPVQKRVFMGYDSDPPQANLNFVVRYRPDEQPALQPHHDASTYTINIALNTPHKDYEGGGCRFVRQDCSVTESRRGWMLMHPGRLTHYHEGLPTTKGTRYIFVSFVDPE
ncbi:multifunctional procollagen lysine hydroxylase and glycosyltransferase LH3-like [Amphibalanus amphitrite]|uniref:multifunctional procollagen lysine hydroxylase and glycosyltransferase LH3-like n=1 Tax=Amphibalanus amphitrite TaxID=1232801 RepID=UPI001C90EDCF|nr:multifunctional procollagen lysine hydroxylase and glycosyltransferase LH3-like [Amphibalanus amphitrite]